MSDADRKAKYRNALEGIAALLSTIDELSFAHPQNNNEWRESGALSRATLAAHEVRRSLQTAHDAVSSETPGYAGYLASQVE